MSFNIQVPSFHGDEVRDFLYTKYNEYLKVNAEVRINKLYKKADSLMQKLIQCQG